MMNERRRWFLPSHDFRGRTVLRHGLLVVIAAGLAGLAGVHADAQDNASPLASNRPLVVAPRDISVVEPGYVLAADPSTGVVSVGTPSGQLITSLTLTALIGRDALPAGARIRLTNSGGTLVADTVGRDGATLVHAVLLPGKHSVAISVSGVAGAVRSASPVFLSDGVQGLDLTAAVASWTPDPQQPADGSVMIVSSTGRRPLTPPPFDLQWQVPQAGWFGVGVADVPNATSMWLSQQGIAIDYPLDVLSRIADTGGGGMAGSMLRFPPLVLTIGAASARDGLASYRDALVGLGDAPATPAVVPAWAWQPIVDTWGEQMAEHVERGNAKFTTAWVRTFVADWTKRYGVGAVTVVIDSRWQQTLGDPTPDAKRFGGIAGMRHLIDDLHAAGMRVELWWPLWARGPAGLTTSADQPGGVTAPFDPSAPGADAQVAQAVHVMLGAGPGELNADGLKLDWSYAMPRAVANPSAGWGVNLLHHYLTQIHTAAHAARPDAVVETSAAAPQFADVSDVVRLYDAWSETDWSARAATVSATLPGIPIDGDGWDVPRAAAAVHAVAASVYGVPAVYFGRLWGDRTAVSAADATLIGRVIGLAGGKGPGSAAPVDGGSDWRFTGSSGTVAESFGGAHGLVVWSAADAGGRRRGAVVSTVSGVVTVPVPLPLSGAVVAHDSAGHVLTVRAVRGGVRLVLRVAQVVTLTMAPGG